MCMPPICADIGLSLVTIIELTANQSRNPVGNGTSSPADIVEEASNKTKIPTRPEIRKSLRSTVFLLHKSLKCEILFCRDLEIAKSSYSNLSLKLEPNRHQRRVPL